MLFGVLGADQGLRLEFKAATEGSSLTPKPPKPFLVDVPCLWGEDWLLVSGQAAWRSRAGLRL